MKKLIATLLVCFFYSIPASRAQDTLFPKSGKPVVVTIVRGVDTIFYRTSKDPAAPESWILIWDLKSVHHADGSISEYIDHPQPEARLIFSGGLAYSNERITLVPGFGLAYSKIGFNLTAGYESHKFGYKKRFSADVLFSYIRKGGYYNTPILFRDASGADIGYEMGEFPETINYLSAALSLKYYISRHVYAKLGMNTAIELSGSVPVYFYSTGRNDHYTDANVEAGYFKSTAGFQYSIGYASSPKKKTGFIMEFDGIADLTPSGHRSEYHPIYYNNCFMAHAGIFVRIGK